ncbi:hypothetical protein ACFFWC_23405 [Plantactinospora siamensis]|uniref:Uncharacterized protein n=1 Tax=Plantactinospora siamensis TaxID=555372 RepID=A0ABV6NUE4_9ACTN
MPHIDHDAVDSNLHATQNLEPDPHDCPRPQALRSPPTLSLFSAAPSAHTHEL